MLRAAALLALAGPAPADLRLAVEGACPGREQVRAAVLRSLERAGTRWPDGRAIDLRVAEHDGEVHLELAGTDGRLLLARSFRDEASDCAARAETVGLVVARYVESLGWRAEPEPIVVAAVAAPAPRPSASPTHVGFEVGVAVAGGVSDASGDTTVDPGPQVGLRVGRGALGAALRAAWLPGESFRASGTAGRARVDRVPVSATGLWSLRRGRVAFGFGPRLVLEAVRSAGATDGLRTDTTLAVRAGGEVDLRVAFGERVYAGLSGGADVSLRRVEIQVRDPDTSEAVPLAGQDVVVPFAQGFLGVRWNLGR
jgi:hypothetical protein